MNALLLLLWLAGLVQILIAASNFFLPRKLSQEQPSRPAPGCPQRRHSNQMFRAFPEKPYRQRAKIESIFSAVKRKLSSRAPGRSLATQIRQALLLGLVYNIYRLRHRFAQRGCQQSPTLAGDFVSVDFKWVSARQRSWGF